MKTPPLTVLYFTWSLYLKMIEGIVLLRSEFTVQCAGVNVIFVFDELQPDARTYYTNINFARYLVRGMDNDAYVTLLTSSVSKSRTRLGVNFFSVKKAELTPSMWHRRFESTWTLRDLVDVCKEAKSQVVLIGVNIRHSSFFATLLTGLEFPEIIKTPKRYGRIYDLLDLKIYDLHYNVAMKGSDRENKDDHVTNTTITYTSKRRLAQHTITYYKNVEIFQESFKFLQSDVCRLTRVFRPGGKSCPEHYLCSGYFEYNVNRIDFSIKSPKYSWKSVLLLKPFLRRMDFALEHLDWKSAKEACSHHGMIPLIIQNEREVKVFSQSITHYMPVLAQAVAIADGFDKRELIMMIGLKRSMKSVGRRFSWGEHKDLVYSHWGPGQPRDTFINECVYWKFNRTHTRLEFVDQGWFTSSCGEKGASVTLCDSNILPSNNSQLLSMRQEEVSTAEIFKKGALSAIERRAAGESTIMAMVSLSTLTRGVFNGQIDKDTISISRVILGKSGIMSRPEIELLFEHLNYLYYQCPSDGRSVSSRAIPLSHICDGTVDCPTGDDEDLCSDFNDVSCSPTHFSCKSGQCVPLEAKCDLMKDCQDGSDEEDCELDCPHRQCPSGRCLPKSWFSDGQEDCDDGFDEGSNASSIETCVFICNRSECITRAMLNDSVLDCQGPEGPLDETLGALESMNCSETGEMTFINYWAPKCVLVRDNFGELIGCRDFQHLAGCSDFSCPRNFVKCPESFCIPLSYVGDGKQDCDYGEDEGEHPIMNINNFFLCDFRSKQRVPLSAICDGKKDCALGQDELECGIHCSPGFICLPGAIMAYNISEILTPQLLSFTDTQTRYLDLSTVRVPEFFHIYPRGRLHYLFYLKLSRCDINTVSINLRKYVSLSKNYNSKIDQRLRYSDFSLLHILDLSYNKLKEIQGRSHFNKMHRLRNLDLSHNFHLSYISQESFIGLKHLEILDLSFTRITFLGKRTFEVLINLRKLSLKGTGLTAINFVFPQNVRYLNFEGTKISDISQDVFSNVKSLRELLSPTFKLCCPVVLGTHIQSHACHFPGDSIHSCDDLIEEPGLRALLWIVCSATLVGNIVTLVYRLTWDRAIVCKPYGLFVTNLGMSDLMMGIYLMIITVADATFKDMYVLHDYRWRHSHACSIAGVVGTLSSITSTVFIALITVDRFLAVQYPYGEVRFTVRTMVAAVVITWVYGAMAASLPMMPFAQDWVIFSNSEMCLGLPFNEKRLPGWQYSAVMFVAVNLLLFIFIGIGQYRIFKIIREKRKRTKKHVNRSNRLSQNQRLQEIAVAKQLSLIVMTNFFCWFPIITMGIVALSGHDLGQLIYSLSATLILPINSALNPVLYTLPALKKKWDDFRALKREVHKARKSKASVDLTHLENTLGKKSDTRRIALLKSKRSTRALRQALLKTKQGTFAESDLKLMYEKVCQHLLVYSRN